MLRIIDHKSPHLMHLIQPNNYKVYIINIRHGGSYYIYILLSVAILITKYYYNVLLL